MLSEETWEILLKVHLGISSQFLKDDINPNNPYEQLVPYIVENLFDLWLISEAQKPGLFEFYSKLACEWIHREDVIKSWFSTCKGLTEKFINLVYGGQCIYTPHFIIQPTQQIDEASLIKNFGALAIIFPNEKKPRIYNISPEQVIYLWFRFLLLFENQTVQGKMPKSYLDYVIELLKKIAKATNPLNGLRQDVNLDWNEVSHIKSHN